MDSKNIIIAILALTTAAGGVYAWKENHRASDLQAQVTKLKANASSSKQRTSRDAQQSSGGSKKSSDRSQAPDDQRQQMSGGAIRNLMQSPKAAPLLASQQRAMIENRYASLFKSLDLPPDQLAKFKNLLIEKQTAARDVITVAREQGLTDRNEINQLIQQAQADVDNSIASLIGTDKLAQYQNYDQTAPQRAVVSQVEQRLSYTSEPLSPAQSTQLVALLAQNTPARGDNGESRAFGVSIGGMGPMTFGQGVGVPITNQVINAAQAFLSPGQLDALRQMQSEQADQQQLQQMLRAGSGGGGGGGGSSAKSKTRHNH